jgi:hypothetical protein
MTPVLCISLGRKDLNVVEDLTAQVVTVHSDARGAVCRARRLCAWQVLRAVRDEGGSACRGYPLGVNACISAFVEQQCVLRRPSQHRLDARVTCTGLSECGAKIDAEGVAAESRPRL